MTTESGDLLYWAFTVAAALIAMRVAVNFWYEFSAGEPILQVVALGAAALIWLLGLGCRYILAGR